MVKNQDEVDWIALREIYMNELRKEFNVTNESPIRVLYYLALAIMICTEMEIIFCQVGNAAVSNNIVNKLYTTLKRECIYTSWWQLYRLFSARF